MADAEKIPKTIHYCWFGKKKLPRSAIKCIESWKRYCPECEIKRWDETNFDVNENAFCRDAYKNQAWAFVSDYARLKIIYENGGIYLDTDVELLKEVSPLLGHECYLAVQQDRSLVATGLGFGATKNNKAVKKMLDEYSNLKYSDKSRAALACPLLNTEAIKKNYGDYNKDEITIFDNGKLAIYPPKYFDPLAPGYSKSLLSEEAFSVHHYDASWCGNKTKLKRKLVNKIGQERVCKVKKVLRRGSK